MKNKCLVCLDNSMELSGVYPGLLKCNCCDFLTADINLTEEDSVKLYGKDYFHGQEYYDYISDRDIIQRNFNRRLKVLSKYLIPSQNRLLEIGCAYGFFLELIKDKFDKSFGVDISTDAVNYATNELNVTALSGNYLNMDIEPYDICCMWDTIEHLQAPDEFIKKISREISPNGLLAITTSDIGSLNAKIRKRKWRQIHPPTHLHYFTVPTLRKLLERNGFSVIHVSHPGNLISIKTALYIVLVVKKNKPHLYKIISKMFGKDWHVSINFRDLMFVIAKKD